MELAVEPPAAIGRLPQSPEPVFPAISEQPSSPQPPITPIGNSTPEAPITTAEPPAVPGPSPSPPTDPPQSTAVDAMETTPQAPEQPNTEQNATSAPEPAEMDVDPVPVPVPVPAPAPAPAPAADPEEQPPALSNIELPTEPTDSASTNDTSSDDSTRPTSEGSAESNDSTSDDGEPEEKPEEEPAYWADIEEDTSGPDEAELKEIESADADYSAYEYNYWEKTFYRDPEDPEYQPSEKARLTWQIRGVRGTKDKPNRSTVMRSPAAYIGGHYWTIKFFPRGNSVSSLSIYVECSATPPEPDKEIPETQFKVIKGAPDADLSTLVPAVDISMPATLGTKDTEKKKAASEDEKEKVESSVETVEVSETPTKDDAKPESKKDWRISAQIGVIVYNPDEPRTGWMQSSCHQFNPNNVDWGWTHFHGPWDQIHKRHHGQRQALLRNDTLAFDAYIRIFDDPTQSLWWHPSDMEPIWDSLTLTGYRPLGDPMVNYSHEVAGLATWLFLAPFREIIQSVDILEHLTNSGVKPRPLCDALQRLLWAMRQERGSNPLYVDTDQVTTTLRNLHEFSGDVTEFWERLRRTLELELAGTDAADKISKMFDSPRVDNGEMAVDGQQANCLPRDTNGRIRVPVKNAKSIQEATKQYLSETPGKWSLPSVFHIELARQTFDKVSRQWNMVYDRVKLDETLDLSDIVIDGQTGKYSIYGLIVHKGTRSSGRFYSILRPGGPNTRWLAFEDASDNKIECMTKKAAINGHEGAEGEELEKIDKNGIDVAVIAIYVRDDVVPQYLTGKIEPWTASDQCNHYFQNSYYSLDSEFKNSPTSTIQVELFSLPDLSSIDKSILDSYDLMEAARSAGHFISLSVSPSTTFIELRKQIAALKSTADKEVEVGSVRIWQLGARKPLFPPTLHFQIIDDCFEAIKNFELKTLRLWFHILSDEDAKTFALPENAPEKPAEEPAEESAPEPSQEAPEESQAAQAESNDSEMNDASAEDHEASTRPAEQTSEPANEHSTPQPEAPSQITPSEEEQQPPASSDTQMQDAVETVEQNGGDISNEAALNEAAISAIIAQDLQDFDAMDAEPSPPATQPGVQPANIDEAQTQPEVIPTENAGTTTPSEEPPQTAAETDTQNTIEPAAPADDNDAIMEDTPAPEASENSTNDPAPETEDPEEEGTEQTITENTTPASQLVPLCAQVYYFVQKFDAEKQALSSVGAFFAKKEDSVRDAVRTALGYDADKQFLLWHRVDGISIVGISPSETFENVVGYTDGDCFVVGEVISKAERTKLAEAGLFSTPDRLVSYLWAVSRNHPTKSFTGTKTTEATYNGDFYSGEFKNGYFHGSGTHISESGATYNGSFVLGERQGTGTMEYVSGDTYSGDWAEDQRHGQGTFIERKTGNKYVGGYRNGKRHGKGVSYWEVADEEMDLCQICYSENQDSLFYTCGHVCACIGCARQVEICPMCRKKVVNVVKIFKS
ncbi:hypothetical protein LOZ51_001245 [Ophidiomyces ophidiicola]|nr:hypothetical protein LOZ54_006574 [Ophidiomyces ophidiicola]KAI2000954.1 hypothetical protein LOZ51_001245 [Ophidiomyces ophidiicola]